MLDDEILKGFLGETQKLIDELTNISDQFEETSNLPLLEQFGQIIDRIMGTAYTLELQEIGRFCELGKKISYKASQATDKKLIELTGPILADTTEILEAMVIGLVEKSRHPSKETLDAFATRLRWFLEKFQDIERATTSS
ncbi:MAG: hypothetical protein WDA09_06835 [Bacteriovoracaceae bacterium]